MKNLKQLIKHLIPSFFIYLIKALPEYSTDLIRYYKYSGIRDYQNDKTKLLGKIIERYHSIEKGLTMPDFRKGFGQKQLMSLINDCKKFINKYGNTDQQLQHAISAVLEYSECHSNYKFKLNPNIQKSIADLKSFMPQSKASEQTICFKNDYFKDNKSSFLNFSNSRHSIRNYTKEEVSIYKILNSISIAQNAPSACNRQTTRVLIFTNKEKIKNILEIQGGTRGFGHLTNKLIIITSELGVFGFINERNQAYVDGGIFSMNILYSLHFNDIATCILNCSFPRKKENKIRNLCNIKNSEVFISMIACGNPPEKFHITNSKRHSTKDIINIIPE